MYQVYYIPRIHDDFLVGEFFELEQAKEYMLKLKEHKPKQYEHHYIWDNEKEIKVKI